MKKTLFLFFMILLVVPSLALATNGLASESGQTIIRARVLEVLESGREDIGGGLLSVLQKLQVQILEGDKRGKEIIVKNDYVALEKGEQFFLMENLNSEDGVTTFTVFDKDRTFGLEVLAGLFLVCLFLFGGIQGIRGLISLLGSVVLIIFVLIPGILHGYSPILVTIGVSSLIIIAGSYVTHGFNKTTSSAVLGMIATVVFTGILAYLAVHFTSLSGFESEEAIYLNWNTGGTIDFVGLLFGGIMIGLLGVLYDVAIGQAIAVEELMIAGPHYSRKQILSRGIRIGKEHTGALVNTLAIAYVGASLPLLLLFYGNGQSSLVSIINSEIFATEIVRTLVGSIGLILAVPITTLISVFMLVKREGDASEAGHDEKVVKHLHHHHH